MTKSGPRLGVRHIVFLFLELALFINGLVLDMAMAAIILLVTHVVEREAKKDGLFTHKEKWLVVSTTLLHPILAGPFYYFCWKKRLPEKAKAAAIYAAIFLVMWTMILLAILGLSRTGLLA